MELLPEMRNCVRGVIMREDKLLVQHKIYEDGSEKYTLPGGASNTGEPLELALKRECLEEIGCEVKVDGLLYVADYFKEKRSPAGIYRHQVEFLFKCHVPETYVAQNGPHPDKHQKDVVWIAISEIDNNSFAPSGLASIISKQTNSSNTYLGLIK